MTLERIPLYRVWVMASTVDVAGLRRFPWVWAKWQWEPRLIPIELPILMGSTGRATFRLLRKTRAEPRVGIFKTYDSLVLKNAWICVTEGSEMLGADGQLDPDVVRWWGWINHLDLVPIAGVDDEIGTVSALQVGDLFDRTQIEGFAQTKPDSEYTAALNSPPTANLSTAGGQVIGNAELASGPDGEPLHAFARAPADCGTDPDQYFTPWRLLRHATVLCRCRAWPPLEISAADVTDEGAVTVDGDGAPQGSALATYLDGTDAPEVYDLRGLTWKGLLDRLLPGSSSLVWEVRIGRDRWYIHVSSAADDAAYGVPVVTAVDVDLTELELDGTPTFSEDATTLPDEIVVEGAPILIGASVDETHFEKAWADAQETEYEDADPAERNRPQLEDVFTLFRLKTNINGDLRRSTTPGENGGTDRPLVPEIAWDGSIATVLQTTSRAPYLPTARLGRTVPWPVGRPANLADTDNRDARTKANPAYLKVKAFRHDPDAAASERWVDLSKAETSPAIDVDDRGAAMRIAFTPPHLLGKDTLATSADQDGKAPIHDWRDLVLTIAIESDQRLRVVKRRPGVLYASEVARRLVVQNDKWQCWVVLAGTVLGIKLDGSTTDPDRASTDVFTRDDWAAAERYANQLAAYAFRTRAAVRMTLAAPASLPSWAKIGKRIGKLIEAQAVPGVSAEISREANAVVTAVTYRFDEAARMRVDIPLDLPSAPAIREVMASATAGGAISVSGGGTVAQVAHAAAQGVARLQRELQRVPIEPPRTPSGLPLRVIRVASTSNNQEIVAGVNGCKWTSDTLTEVSAAYDPESETAITDDGICYAVDDEGAACLLITAQFTVDGVTFGGRPGGDLYNGTDVVCLRQRTIPVAGGLGETVTAWECYWL